VIVQNLQRNIFIVNKEDVPFSEISAELEEVKKKYFARYMFSWSKEIAKRKYAFELPIAYEEKEYTLVKYSYQYPALPADLKGKNFDGVVGTTYTALELFLLKRKIKVTI
jgi:DNA polymerase alpha subunit A